MLWHVRDETNDATPMDVTLEADTEKAAKAEWCRIAGAEPSLVDEHEIVATPICPKCKTHAEVVWVDAWRDYTCRTCKEIL